MKLLLLAVAVAVAVASKVHPARHNHRWVQENAPEYGIESNKFEAGKEYQYMYNGQLMTGIPQSSEQHSSTRIQAVVSILFREHNKLSMQLRHVRFASLNDKVSEPRRLQPFGLFEPIDIAAEHLETLRLPVESKYVHGMIKDLAFDGADAPWSVNIKRGVLNMIQVNLRKERRTDLSQEMEKESIQPLDMFTTQEETIEGDCETVYTVESLPQQYRREIDDDVNVLNVTKSINFDKCQVRPRIDYNWRVADVCPTCEGRYNKEEKTVRSSTIIRQSLLVTDKRDKCLVEKVVVESQYTIVPFKNDGNVMQTYVNMTLELIKASDRVNSIPRISERVESDSRLMTTLDLDVLKEEFNMHGKQDFIEQLPYGFRDTKAIVRHCLERVIDESRDIGKDAPRYFSRLVTTLRMLTAGEIEQVHDKFMKSTPFNAKDTAIVRPLLLDAMAIAGTQPAIEHIVEKIAARKVAPIRAALLLRKLSSPRVVSRQILSTVERLTTEETCKHSRAVWQSAQLAYGSLINVACKDTGMDRTAIAYKRQVRPSQSTTPVCDRELKQELTDKLFAKFEECESTFCKVVVLKSIANAGLDLAIEPLAKIITSVEYSPLIRVEAVLATRQLVDVMPRKVQQVLLPVYLARRQTPPQVRIAAIHQLLKTLPEKSLLDQLTRSLLVEENKQVAAYTFTIMNSLANSTNPCEKKFAEDLTLSLRHARYVPTNEWLSYSKNVRAQFFSQKMNAGASIDWNSVLNKESMIPSDLSSSIDLTAGNQWMRNLLTIGGSQQNMNQFVQQLARRYSSIYNSVTTDSSKSSEEGINGEELTGFFESLDMADWDSKSETEPYMQFYIRTMNMDYGVLPIDSALLPEWLKEMGSEMDIIRMVRKAEKLLKDQTINLDIHGGSILHEDKTKISTVLGLPLVYSHKTPVTAKITGRVSFKYSKPAAKFSVILNSVRPRVTLAQVYRVDAWSPIVNSGLKVVGNVLVNTPIDANIDVNMVKPEIKIAFSPISQQTDILRIQSRPITTVLEWGVGREAWKEPREMTVQGEWNRETTIKKQFGKRSLGVEFDIRGHYHTTPMKKVSTTPYSELAGPNKIAITVRPGLEMPKKYEIIIGGKFFERLSKQKMGQPMKDFFSESDEYLQSSEEDNEYPTEYEGRNPTHNQVRVIFKTVGSPIKREAEIEASLKCGDKNKACTYKFNVKRSPVPSSEETSQWSLKSELSVLYPETPKGFEQIGKYMCRLNAKWGAGKFVDLKLVGEQSELMENLIERSVYRRSALKHSKTHKSLYSPVSRHEQLVKYSVLDQYKIDADYSVDPTVRNMTEKVLRLAKNFYYWQMEVNSELPREMRSKNQIRARVNIDPVNGQYVNVTIQTPVERVLFKDIALPLPVRGVNLRSGESFRPIGREESGICQLRSGRVQTFDGVAYSTPVPSCWTLLTKDCRRSSKFAVFVKETEGELKSLKIVTQHVKLIVRAMPELECELNSEKVDCGQIEEIFVHGRHLALRVTQGEYLKVELPEAGLRVYFDGLSVNVKTNQMYSSELCGLCGQFDGEERCELMTAQRKCLSSAIPREIRQFVQSYMLEECSISEAEEAYTHQPLSWQQNGYRRIYGEEDTPITYGYNRNDKRTISPRQSTRVIEQRSQVCFSKSPVRRCPMGTRPIEHQQTMTKVVYACLDRSDMEVDRLHRAASRHQIITEIADYDASFTHEHYEPVKCIRA